MVTLKTVSSELIETCKALCVIGHIRSQTEYCSDRKPFSGVPYLNLQECLPWKWTEKSRKVLCSPPPLPSAARGNGLVCAEWLWCGFSVWAPMVSYPQVENLSDCVGTSLLQLSTAGVPFHFCYIFLPFFLPHIVSSSPAFSSLPPAPSPPLTFSTFLLISHLSNHPFLLFSCLTHGVLLQCLTPSLMKEILALVTPARFDREKLNGSIEKSAGEISLERK